MNNRLFTSQKRKINSQCMWQICNLHHSNKIFLLPADSLKLAFDGWILPSTTTTKTCFDVNFSYFAKFPLFVMTTAWLHILIAWPLQDYHCNLRNTTVIDSLVSIHYVKKKKLFCQIQQNVFSSNMGISRFWKTF